MPSKKNQKRRWLPALIIFFATTVVTVILVPTTPIQLLELKFTDQLFLWRGPLDVSHSPIVIVAMSEDADDEIPEKYPWPTNIYAKLIENLNEAGAKAIIFDVVFRDQDIYDPRNDTLFAQAMQKYGNVVLAGEIRREESRFRTEIISDIPLPIFSSLNPNPYGLVRVNKNVDGAVRTYAFGLKNVEQVIYMIGLEGIRIYENLDRADMAPLEAHSDSFRIGSYAIPKYRPNAFLINYYGPEKTFPEISLEAVIDDQEYKTVFEQELDFDINQFDNPENGLLQQDIFKDKMVIVGSTMPLLRDFFATPFANDRNNPRPGYEIHAHAIQTVLDGNYLTKQRGIWTILLILLFSACIVLINRYYNTLVGILISAGIAGGVMLAACFAFMNFNFIMSVTGPVLSIVIAQITMVSYEYLMEYKEKKRIKGMFSSYVSPELVEQMVQSGEEPQLGGEETFMTAFFSDIVSFSTFSEQLEPAKLVSLINEYLSSMTDIINTNGGTLDKYIGDAIVAFYGAPVYIPDHAYKACISSILMQHELERLCEKWKKDGWPEIVSSMQQRIGMNTGNMVTGNMGSTRRFNYTMMGDNVNLAARCESAAKQYGIFSMITETTKTEAEKTGDDILFRLLDHIVVKGKTKPVKVYEVIDLKSNVNEQTKEGIGLFEEGFEQYVLGNWEQAIHLFKQSAKLERYEKNPSQIFINRCKKMQRELSIDNWNGVYVLKEK